MYKSFRELYSNLGRPTLQLRPFEGRNIPRSRKMNLSMREIEADLDLAYREVDTLGNSFVEVFNFAHALSSELLNSAQGVSSKVVDLRLLAGQLDTQVLVAGDDFHDTSRIDTSFGLQNPRAEVSTIQGIATLARTESVNILTDNTQIQVHHIKPQDLKVNPTVGNVNRFYEGNFYNYIGNARPEGGIFHLEESLSVNVPDAGITTNIIEIESSDSSADQVRDGDFIQPFINQSGRPGPGQILRPEDIIVYDRGASEGEKALVRRLLVDENPSSFWECEYVKTEDSVQALADQARLIRPDGEQADFVTVGEGEEIDALSSSVTLDDLRSQANLTSQGSEDDLVVDVTLTLEAPQAVNWISINPNNFEDTAWIDVLDISYASDENTPFQTIPGFNDNIYDNILTDEANTELSDEGVGAILAPNKFSYKGLGVWSFEAVQARVIKMRLRQRTSVPAPYQRLAIRLHRVYTQVYTETSVDASM